MLSCISSASRTCSEALSPSQSATTCIMAVALLERSVGGVSGSPTLSFTFRWERLKLTVALVRPVLGFKVLGYFREGISYANDLVDLRRGHLEVLRRWDKKFSRKYRC